jgi:trehalose-6-phosphate synthase
MTAVSTESTEQAVAAEPTLERAQVESSSLPRAGPHELVIVANRPPVRRTAIRADSAEAWTTSPGGLVAALAPIVRERRGVWIGWPGSAASATAPFAAAGITNLPITISRTELTEFYQGQCNSTFWPLYHDAVREPEYHRRWWTRYVEVNQRFVASRTDASGVLVFSEFAGAVDELRGALQVNPHDVDGLAETIEEALHLRPREVRRRMRSLQQAVEGNTVNDWAKSYLSALAGR